MQISVWPTSGFSNTKIMPRLTSDPVSMSLRMFYLSCVKIRELQCPAKTEQKLALGG